MSRDPTALAVVKPLLSVFDKNPDTASAARRGIRADPETALAAFRACEGAGLSIHQQGRLFEAILGEITEPKEAQRMVEEVIGLEAAAEMAAQVGSIPGAVATAVLDTETIFAALLQDAGEDPVYTGVMLQAWASNLKDRSDWEELLNREIGGFTLRDLLILAIHTEYIERNFDDKETIDEDEPVDLADFRLVSSDVWIEFGLDPDDAEQRLSELLTLEVEDRPVFDDDAVETARKRLRLKAKAARIAVDELVAAAAAAIDEID